MAENEIGNKFSGVGSGPRLNRRVQVTRGPRPEIIISTFQFVPQKTVYFSYKYIQQYFSHFINCISFRLSAVFPSFSQLYFVLPVIDKLAKANLVAVSDKMFPINDRYFNFLKRIFDHLYLLHKVGFHSSWESVLE